MAAELHRDTPSPPHGLLVGRKDKDLNSEKQSFVVSEQTLSQFLQRVAHDLRGPLRRIRVFSRVLAEEEKDNLTADGQEALEFIEISVRQAKSRLDGAERLARSLSLQLAPRPVADARALLTRALTAAGRPFARVEGELPQRLVTDPRLLTETLDELLKNAEQWGDGVDWLDSRVTGTSWEITVHDAGPGVESEDRARAFAPFETLGRDGGAGVGLTVAQCLARRLGGEIGLAASDGGGLAARVSIPLLGPESVSGQT